MRHLCDAGEHVGQPGERIDVVELCRHDQCRDGRGTANVYRERQALTCRRRVRSRQRAMIFFLARISHEATAHRGL